MNIYEMLLEMLPVLKIVAWTQCWQYGNILGNKMEISGFHVKIGCQCTYIYDQYIKKNVWSIFIVNL